MTATIECSYVHELRFASDESFPRAVESHLSDYLCERDGDSVVCHRNAADRDAYRSGGGDPYQYEAVFAIVARPSSLVISGIWSRSGEALRCRELLVTLLPPDAQHRSNPHHDFADFDIDRIFRDVTDRSDFRVRRSCNANDDTATAWERVDDIIELRPLDDAHFDLDPIRASLEGICSASPDGIYPLGMGVHVARVELAADVLTCDVTHASADDIALVRRVVSSVLQRAPCSARAHRETTYNHDELRREEISVWHGPIVVDDIFPPTSVPT